MTQNINPPHGPDGGYAPSPTPQRSNGLATAGFVIALIGAVLALIPFVGIVSWALAPIGLVLSAVGLTRVRTRQTGRGLSIAGIVLAIVALILCVLQTVLFAGAVNNVQQQNTAVHNVTYQVSTSHGSNVTVTYSQFQNGNFGSGSAMNVASPWSANTQVSGTAGATVTGTLAGDINNINPSDTITCTITEDGAQVAQNSASGQNASVTCSQ